MCGIAGIWTKNGLTTGHEASLNAAIGCIAHRGPDATGSQSYAKAAFGHTRLSIIDVSSRSNQPMTSPDGRYCLVFNGEIYNHKTLGKDLHSAYSIELHTTSDTEVLLLGLIHEGKDFLPKLNGFFAFAFYDTLSNTLLCARDRYGIKPFYYSNTVDQVAFGSNLSAVIPFVDNPTISAESLNTYLQFSYIPDPLSMIEGVAKLPPGYSMECNSEGVELQAWYRISLEGSGPSGKNPVSEFRNLMQESVAARLIADVPVGTFLSGGLDSSVITLLASRAHGDVPAFSIGFPDHPFFDESRHAAAIAKHLGVRHEIFEVRERDIEEELGNILDAIDEPFADSSAVLVNILSKRTRREVKVALSGDGADELLGGYNKHRALLRSQHSGITNRVLRSSAPALSLLPNSRNHAVWDRLRKIRRYSGGLRLDFAERYKAWASFTPKAEVEALLIPGMRFSQGLTAVQQKLDLLDPQDFNSVLVTDMALVLAGDMLQKVDSMSMHRALEVRVPFLDHRVVDYVMALPHAEKIDHKSGKKLLRKAFTDDFPDGAFDRGKRGFEAPLKHWMNTVLNAELDRLLSPRFIESQNIFDLASVQKLRRKVKGVNPGDAAHTLWAILVFQHWWERNLSAVVAVK